MYSDVSQTFLFMRSNWVCLLKIQIPGTVPHLWNGSLRGSTGCLGNTSGGNGGLRLQILVLGGLRVFHLRALLSVRFYNRTCWPLGVIGSHRLNKGAGCDRDGCPHLIGDYGDSQLCLLLGATKVNKMMPLPPGSLNSESPKRAEPEECSKPQVTLLWS